MASSETLLFGFRRESGTGSLRTRLACSPHPGVQGRPEDWGRIVLE